eukprot:TRINITY_DN47831_c0_g1_i1.p1 TRINITY_DN47831_c0_g1~~TRINITY_DN47831_c0_g1_i1.p1  ORF type:complete len:932 (+),score=111.14 TRINITY_DN47831_c0_g1_i1:53-2848(+)
MLPRVLLLLALLPDVEGVDENMSCGINAANMTPHDGSVMISFKARSNQRRAPWTDLSLSDSDWEDILNSLMEENDFVTWGHMEEALQSHSAASKKEAEKYFGIFDLDNDRVLNASELESLRGFAFADRVDPTDTVDSTPVGKDDRRRRSRRRRSRRRNFQCPYTHECTPDVAEQLAHGNSENTDSLAWTNQNTERKIALALASVRDFLGFLEIALDKKTAYLATWTGIKALSIDVGPQFFIAIEIGTVIINSLTWLLSNKQETCPEGMDPGECYFRYIAKYLQEYVITMEGDQQYRQLQGALSAVYKQEFYNDYFMRGLAELAVQNHPGACQFEDSDEPWLYRNRTCGEIETKVNDKSCMELAQDFVPNCESGNIRCKGGSCQGYIDWCCGKGWNTSGCMWNGQLPKTAHDIITIVEAAGNCPQCAEMCSVTDVPSTCPVQNTAPPPSILTRGKNYVAKHYPYVCGPCAPDLIPPYLPGNAGAMDNVLKDCILSFGCKGVSCFPDTSSCIQVTMAQSKTNNIPPFSCAPYEGIDADSFGDLQLDEGERYGCCAKYGTCKTSDRKDRTCGFDAPPCNIQPPLQVEGADVCFGLGGVRASSFPNTTAPAGQQYLCCPPTVKEKDLSCFGGFGTIKNLSPCADVGRSGCDESTVTENRQCFQLDVPPNCFNDATDRVCGLTSPPCFIKTQTKKKLNGTSCTQASTLSILNESSETACIIKGNMRSLMRTMELALENPYMFALYEPALAINVPTYTVPYFAAYVNLIVTFHTRYSFTPAGKKSLLQRLDDTLKGVRNGIQGAKDYRLNQSLWLKHGVRTEDCSPRSFYCDHCIRKYFEGSDTFRDCASFKFSTVFYQNGGDCGCGPYACSCCPEYHDLKTKNEGINCFQDHYTWIKTQQDAYWNEKLATLDTVKEIRDYIAGLPTSDSRGPLPDC